MTVGQSPRIRPPETASRPCPGARPNGASGSAEAGAWPRAFNFLPFPSKGFTFLPRRLPKASIPFQKLQKFSANRDLSMGYGRRKRTIFVDWRTVAGGRPGRTVDTEAGARPGAFNFLPFPSKGFNFLPRGLPKASIPFQKLKKNSANRDLSMGYGRRKRKTFAGGPIAAGAAGRCDAGASASPSSIASAAFNGLASSILSSIAVRARPDFPREPR